MAQFKPGDVVKLKSGGPRMTVNHGSGDGSLWCVWFVAEQEKGAAFAEAALELAPPDSHPDVAVLPRKKGTRPQI